MSKSIKSEIKGWVKAFAIVAGFTGFLITGTATAAPAQDLQAIADNVQKTVGIVSRMLVTISLMAGIGFIMALFFKFHQHKQNPTQVPISQGITLLLIGSAMVVFPYLLQPLSGAIFGDGSVSKLDGQAIQTIIGQ